MTGLGAVMLAGTWLFPLLMIAGVLLWARS